MSENKTAKSRLTFRPSDETRQRIEQWYKADNCSSLNDFIEKAVNDYIDRLALNDNNRALPIAVTSAIDGRLGMLEKKLSALASQNSITLTNYDADAMVNAISRSYIVNVHLCFETFLKYICVHVRKYGRKQYIEKAQEESWLDCAVKNITDGKLPKDMQ